MPVRSGNVAAHDDRDQHVRGGDRRAREGGPGKQEKRAGNEPQQHARQEGEHGHRDRRVHAQAASQWRGQRRQEAEAQHGQRRQHAAPPDDSPTSDWIRSKTGPMLAAAGRRLMATRTSPPARSAGESARRALRSACTASQASTRGPAQGGPRRRHRGGGCQHPDHERMHDRDTARDGARPSQRPGSRAGDGSAHPRPRRRRWGRRADIQAAARAGCDVGYAIALVEQPYRVAGRRAPAPAAHLDEAWVAVVAWLAERELAGLPLVTGGRSLGARVACRTAGAISSVGVICLAFPLQPPQRASATTPPASRLPELDAVAVPTLVVQGVTDRFGMPPARPLARRGARHRRSCAQGRCPCRAPGRRRLARTPGETPSSPCPPLSRPHPTPTRPGASRSGVVIPSGPGRRAGHRVAARDADAPTPGPPCRA